MYIPMHMYMGGTEKGLTGPDMEAAQQLVHLSSDEEECNSHGKREAKAKVAAQSRGKEGKAGTEANRSAKEDIDHGGDHEGDDHDDDRKREFSRKRRFRSIAYIYKVTQPVRLHDESKRRKNH